MTPNEHPYLVEGLAVRLSLRGAEVRRLDRHDEIIELGGSAGLFLAQMNGRRTVAAIVDAVAAQTEVERATIAADFDELLAGLVQRGVAARSAAAVADADRPYLGILAPELRSTIHIDVTHRCNERCVHCLVPRDQQEIPFPDLRDLAHQAARLGFTGLSFSGGEPTLHPQFWELLQLTRDLGFYATIFSNGLGLDDEAVARLAAHRPKHVRVSLYSMDPGVHDRVTGVPGSLARTLRAVLALAAAGVRIYVNSPVANVNYDGFRAIAAFCEEHGFERNFDPVIQPTRDGTNAHAELQLSWAQAKDVTGFQQYAAELVCNVQPGTSVCNAGDDPSVDAALDFYACPGVRLPLGNLRERSLEELLAHPTLRELHDLGLDELPVCQRCDVRDGCYRCHGHAFQETGDYRLCSALDRRQAHIRRELMVERGTRKRL
ncbi:MAG TPA: radical SAM protein [Polyangia bacterium]|jgi:radical SAM protein with 4Fe4S-binding SPASM domain